MSHINITKIIYLLFIVVILMLTVKEVSAITTSIIPNGLPYQSASANNQEGLVVLAKVAITEPIIIHLASGIGATFCSVRNFSNGVELERVAVDGAFNCTFDTDFELGIKYFLLSDDNGAVYTRRWNNSNYHVSGTHLNITGGSSRPWADRATPAIIPTFGYSITEIWTTIIDASITANTEEVEPEQENTTTQLNLTVIAIIHNITGSNGAFVNYNGTNYTASQTDINLGVNGNVTYTVNVSTPLVILNNTNIDFIWYYNLTINVNEQNIYNVSSNQTIIWAFPHVTYEWKWYENEIEFSNGSYFSLIVGVNVNLNNLSSTETDEGSNYTFSCRGYDGTSFSDWLNSTSVFIVDIIPTVQTSVIKPLTSKCYADIVANSNVLEGWCNITDPNNATITYMWEWVNNTNSISSGNTSGITAGVDTNINNLSIASIAVGDDITLRCRGYDGSDFSDWKNSTTIPIYNVTLLLDGVDSTTLSTPKTTEQTQLILNSTIVPSGVTTCIDLTTTRYGINTSCDTTSTQFDAAITSFHRRTLNDSSTAKNFSYNGPQNQTFWIQVHQYDEINNLTLNLTGFLDNGTFPKDVKIYIDGSLSNTVGVLSNTTTFVVSEFVGAVTEVTSTIGYPSTVEKMGSIKLPKNATIISVTFTVDAGAAADFNVTQQEADTVTFENDLTTSKSIVNITYNIPDGAVSDSIWTVKYGENGQQDIQFLSNYDDCWRDDQNFLRLRWTSYENFTAGASGTLARSTIECLDTGTWTLMNESNSTSLCTVGSWTLGYDVSNNIHDGSFTSFAHFSDLLPATFKDFWAICVTPQPYAASLYEEKIRWVFENSFPVNPWIQFGTLDSTYEWNQSGDFSGTPFGTYGDATTPINTFLGLCIEDDDGFCEVPVYTYSTAPGVMILNNLTVTYTLGTLNPILLSNTLIQTYLDASANTSNMPIQIENSNNGTIEVSDIDYNYLGGITDQETITAHSADRVCEVTKNITYAYSGWGFNFPSGIEFIVFYPDSPSSQSVAPFGQTDTSPILNISMFNYGANTDYFVKFVASTDCANLTIGTTNSKGAGTTMVNNTFITLATSKSYLSNIDIWLWSDLDCSYTTWRRWNPTLTFKAEAS